MTKARGHDDRAVYFSFNADCRRSTREYRMPTSETASVHRSVKQTGRISTMGGGLIVAAKVVQELMGRRFSGVEVDRMRDTAAKMARLLSERS